MMKLWVTPNGDRWLCNECEELFREQIEEEGWRTAFDKKDPMLRSSEFRLGDVEIVDWIAVRQP